MNPIDIKKHIAENNLHVEVLEKLGCNSVKKYKKGYSCSRPQGNNRSGIFLYEQSLKVRIYTPDLTSSKHYKEEEADIFTLIMIINDCSFFEANKWLHDVLGIKFEISKKKVEKKSSPLDIFTRNINRKTCYVNELSLIDNEALLDFIPYVHIDWVREGITPSVGEEFGIGFSEQKNRIVVPHRLWCGSKDDYVGIVGRTTLAGELCKLLGIAKYFPLIPYAKSQNLYGLNENYQYIQKMKRVVVYEAEKSVLKRASRLDRTGVAIMCHSISDEQVAILRSLGVEIVIAFDSDVPIDKVWEECYKFTGCNVSYMYNAFNLLGAKESPADKREEVYQKLFESRIKFDEEKKQQYLRLKAKKQKSKK